ncbi:uncharacterized protein [Drosophila virilis]|uniref:N-terminal Ras-GEF domain-containing protein n=1 Tax=Drosophila virilis TaxID=7244 RepID=B4LSP0_DROVI|nr:uncharacterized protein LOC6627511 [Drosophila virilis]EDW63779.2 uncharacterized protein Dvir_GJ16562 [Drosophila virilis]
MAMYFYASKISAIVCGTRCKQTVLQKSRGQRDRDKDKCRRHRQRHRSRRRSRCQESSSDSETSADDVYCGLELDATPQPDVGIFLLNASSSSTEAAQPGSLGLELGFANEGMRLRRRHSAEQLNAHDLELGLQHFKPLATKDDPVQYDVPKNTHKRSLCDISFESSVLGSGGIMYINGKIVSGPIDSFPEVLNPKNVIDLDKEFLFSFLLSSRLFLRPHELLGKLLASVSDGQCLETLVALLAEWTQKFPYDYRDERMMSHVKHIVSRCSDSHLEVVVSQVLSALLQRLTDLEQHEADLRACQTNNEKLVAPINCPTATQYAQILCRLEKKLAKHIGPEEFVQCSSMVLLDKQKKWDQPISSGGPPGAQDPKKTCNLETYLDWSARLRLFVCNEILQCTGIEDRSRTVELWSGVAQYCLLVGNYNSATAILESLESPAIARLKITWSKLQVTCQQLDCMQRHAEGHGHLWQKQAIVLNEQQHSLKTDKQPKAASPSITENSSSTSSAAAAVVEVAAATTTGTTSSTSTALEDLDEQPSTSTSGQPVGLTGISGFNAMPDSLERPSLEVPASGNNTVEAAAATAIPPITTTTTTTAATICGKPNDWVVIPVFADIVKLALAERENCLQRLQNGHINVIAFDRMAAIVGAFTKHMQAMKTTQAPSSGEYEHFCTHMQRTTKLGEAELMMASFDCEEPNNAEKLMYDLN